MPARVYEASAKGSYMSGVPGQYDRRPTAAVGPGDVLVVQTNGWASKLIRIGAILQGEPSLDNHVIIAHHYTDPGTTKEIFWGIEGRPGGTGEIDMRRFLDSRWTVNNIRQPKTDAQRATICAAMTAAVGTRYDWDAIASDAAAALHIEDIFPNRERWGNQVPGHVVCSSLAAWGYNKAGLRYPSTHIMPATTPADWEDFISFNKYNRTR